MYKIAHGCNIVFMNCEGNVCILLRDCQRAPPTESNTQRVPNSQATEAKLNHFLRVRLALDVYDVERERAGRASLAPLKVWHEPQAAARRLRADCNNGPRVAVPYALLTALIVPHYVCSRFVILAVTISLKLSASEQFRAESAHNHAIRQPFAYDTSPGRSGTSTRLIRVF